MKKTRFIAAILAGLWSSIAMQVSAQYGTDMTHLLTNPNFEEGATGWTIDGGGGGTIATAANYGYSGTTFMESWVWAPGPLSDRSWHQTIDLPNGIYAVKAMAHAIMQDDKALTPEGVSIFANEDMVPVTTTYTNPPKEYHVFTQVTDGSLTVGLNIVSCNTNWVAWDNVRILHYSSAQTIEEAKIMSAKDEIMALIDKATTLSAEVFADAIAKAQDVYDNATDYDIIVEAINELQGTIAEKEDFCNAKAALKALIDQADASPIRDILSDAIAKAQDVYDTATDYNAIVDATNELQNTIAEKEVFWDAKAALKALIDQADASPIRDILSDAIAKAQDVYDTATDYNTIVEATNELQDTIDEMISTGYFLKEGHLIVFADIEWSYPWESQRYGIRSVEFRDGVTFIGSAAFEGCENLTSITIPASVASINAYAFKGCISLSTVRIPEDSKLTSIDYHAFYDCKNLTSINIPANVTTIDGAAFYDCISLSTVTIPEDSKLTMIGYAAFHGCKSLTSINIPANVTSIENNAFMGCSSLTTVTIPEDSKLNSIGGEAFRDCEKLISINIPASVTSIGIWAFMDCSSLTTISIPEDSKLTSIGQQAFIGCKNLTSINIPTNVTQIELGAFQGCISLSTVTIPENSKLTSIGVSAFGDCKSLSSITIPSGVTSIGDEAFRECHKLSSSITIPNGVTSIGFATFWNCFSLTTVNISEDSELTSIGDEAFYYCEKLSSITIPDKITSIERSAFRHCSSLTTVNISEGSKLTLIGDWAFEGCANLSSITIPNGVTSIGESAFDGCSSLTTVNISEESKLALIKNYTFMGCSNLSSITIPKEVTSIGYGTFVNCSSLTTVMIPEDSKLTSLDYAFNNCSSLSSITIPASVTSIGAGTFANCSSLTTVMIPEDSKLTSIGYATFSGCSSLSSITIPKEVTSIGGEAFRNGIETVYMHSTTPPTLIHTNLIDDYGLFVVPESAYDDYCSADYWKDEVLRNKIATQEAYKREVTITANNEVSALYEALGETTLSRVADLTINGSINSHDFFMMLTKMTALRHLDLTNASIVYNERNHYADCHTEDNIFPAYGLYNCNLLSIKLPKNITSIGNDAFAYNYIKTLDIPESVTKIEFSAFYNCTKLTSVSIPKGVTEIGNGAFCGCNLASIILPPSVETIGWGAFSYCSNLKEVRIPSSVRHIEDLAFEGCTSLKDIYTYTIEPIAIGQNTFPKYGNNFIGTLHAPKVSYANYYNDTQWGQYLSFAEFDEPYENFYLEGDKTLNENTGSINGTEENAPDAEMGENSGIIVEDDVEQDLGDVEIEHNGTDGGSIIVGGEGCVNADKLHFHINVQGGRWYFFCFPFDVKREDIKMENGADWVFRYYDGEERAANGQGGWKNVTSDGNGNHLKAATGYIFQCSQNDVLILTAKNQKLKHEKKYNELVEHLTENMQDASWNFVGNPYLSYYEVTSDDYSAPITVWRDGQYVAIRPGDDDYQLAPFEAFFVQKSEGTDNIEYNPEQQMTYHQAQEAAAKARARRREMPINPERLLVNITLTDGTNTDRTRVVFNNDADMGYETTCDAAKFSTAGVPQLYTVDSRAVKYAINERPVAEGIVTMGYTAPTQGNYTLAAPRMDTPIYVKDNLMGTIHDFSEGSYTFMTEAGTFEGRFTIMMKEGETAIDNSQMTIDNETPTYNVKGQRIENAAEQGIYIKDNRKVVKL